MESKRQQKYSKLIQKELGEIFQREGKPLVGKAMVTVTRVLISPDLGVAKVNLSFLLADNDALFSRINDNKGQIRKFLGNRIGKSVRIIPELVFYLDESAAYAQHMDEVISKLDIPEDADEDESDDEIND
ncbi:MULTISPECIES: 30S ribosome-binding factor RbfA [Cyclobacterium]|uniref:Ribosome-binding factor A n=1 Tax=Cyclobacterium plantarum TaxID=2716263 RepID=A0ABX0H336_9BACT|nr:MULTISPECIES: 30S ribosome-binding factor RbfA [Cyclobacterium]MBD3629202.1 30S ribosome-binding factor RbfA [Cyclobacterium sp.]NHE55283.1 30S ribosome-binding factor RbfA [Cyclobacterium plantarum]